MEEGSLMLDILGKEQSWVTLEYILLIREFHNPYSIPIPPYRVLLFPRVYWMARHHHSLIIVQKREIQTKKSKKNQQAFKNCFLLQSSLKLAQATNEYAYISFVSLYFFFFFFLPPSPFGYLGFFFAHSSHHSVDTKF